MIAGKDAKTFGDFTITRTFRGVEYNIEAKNPDNIEKGVKELKDLPCSKPHGRSFLFF